MKDFKRRKKVDFAVYSKGAALALLVVAGFLVVSVLERYQIEREMAARREAAAAERATLQVRKAELAERVAELSGDRGVETEIRRNFDVAKPGERVVVILEDEESDQTSEESATPPDTPTESTPWYVFW